MHRTRAACTTLQHVTSQHIHQSINSRAVVLPMKQGGRPPVARLFSILSTTCATYHWPTALLCSSTGQSTYLLPRSRTPPARHEFLQNRKNMHSVEKQRYLVTCVTACESEKLPRVRSVRRMQEC